MDDLKIYTTNYNNACLEYNENVKERERLRLQLKNIEALLNSTEDYMSNTRIDIVNHLYNKDLPLYVVSIHNNVNQLLWFDLPNNNTKASKEDCLVFFNVFIELLKSHGFLIDL